MKAVRTHVGRCMYNVGGKQCGKPAAFARPLGNSRQFVYCEEHVPVVMRKEVEKREAEGQAGTR